MTYISHNSNGIRVHITKYTWNYYKTSHPYSDYLDSIKSPTPHSFSLVKQEQTRTPSQGRGQHKTGFGERSKERRSLMQSRELE